MKKYLVRFVSLTAALVATSATGQQVPSDFRIDRIRFEGLERINEQLIRSQIEVREGQPLSAKAVSRDLRRLYELGYFSTIKVDLDTSGPESVLTYVFQEKQFIEEVVIAGNDKIKLKDIREVLSWKQGDTFEREAYSRQRDAILDLYASKNFLNASVQIIVEELPASRVRVTYLIQEGKKARIRKIDFAGNAAIGDRKLRDLMKTKRGYFRIRGKFDAEKFELDLRRILDEYANVGRLDADIVSTDFSYSANGKRLYIAIRVEEGPEYRVNTMTIEDNFVFDHRELSQFVRVRGGNVHDQGRIERDADDIQTEYRENGYINARVSPQVTVDRATASTHVVHRVDEGELKYLRELVITGNSVTRDDVIRRQLLLNPGDRFDGTALRNSRNRLQSTRFFESVRMTAEDLEENDRFADLLLDVDEGKTGNFNFGGGFSTDENFSGFAEIRLNNFDISNWPTFSGGGQQFSSRFVIGDVRSQYSVSFTDPEIFGYPLSFGVDFFDESFRTRGGTSFRQDSQGASLRLGKSLSPFLTLRTTLSFLDVEVSEIEPFLAPELNVLRDPGSTISAAVNLSRNTTDIVFDPNEGSRHDLTLEFAGFSGDNEFVKLEHDSAWFYAIDEEENWVLSLRTREGWAEPFGETQLVPVQERFFAGGSTTVRGYDTRDIGPKARLTDGRREAIGGQFRLIGNLELKLRISDMVSFITFSDAGGVWENLDTFDANDLKYSVGFGFGFMIPALGPLRIDFGIPINPDADQGSSQVHLNSGFRF